MAGRGTTEIGTYLILDLHPDDVVGPNDVPWMGWEGIGLKERLFFPMWDPDHGHELWASDGSPEGTSLFKDLIPGVLDGQPNSFVATARGFCFQAWSPDGPGRDLWISDGTQEGTVPSRASPGIGLDCPAVPRRFEHLVRFQGRDFFFAADEEHGYELWVSDGTPSGTHLFKDLTPGPEWSRNGPIRVIGDRLFVGGMTPQGNGDELWVSDGTVDGTQLFREVVGMPEGWLLCIPVMLPDGRLLMAVSAPSENGGLWVTDGTPRGTVQVTKRYCGDFLWGRFSVGRYLLFGCIPGGSFSDMLWLSDGSPEGTAPLLDSSGLVGPTGDPDVWRYGAVALVGDRVLFVAFHPIQGYQLWAKPVPATTPFHRADPNASGTTDISDAISIFGFLFLGTPATFACHESAAANNDATIDISDGIYLLSWLFTDGPAPPAPGPTDSPCSFDPDPPGSTGDLGCVEYAPCE